MTDIDRLLAEDGARWRHAQPPPPEPDPALLTRPSGHRWLPVAAAAAVAVVVAGGITVAVQQSSGDPPAAAGTAPATRPDTVPNAVVRPGDRVRGEGTVVAIPGRPVRLCPPVATTLLPRLGEPRPPGWCEPGVTLVGTDLDRLPGRRERDGVVWAVAEVTGVFRAGRTVEVTAVDPQRDPGSTLGTSPGLPEDCPAPAGGWPRRQVQNLPGVDQVQQWVARNPDVLGSMSIGYPYPTRSGATGVQVLLVGTTGDVEDARRTVRRWYAGALCVRAVPHSRAQARAAAGVLRDAFADPAQVARYGLTFGAGGDGSDGGDPRTSVAVLVHDGTVQELVASAGGAAPAGVVDVEPMLGKLP